MKKLRLPLAIFAVALIVRAGYYGLSGFPAGVAVPGERSAALYDAQDYDRIARSLLDYGIYGYEGRASSYRPPAYPFFMAAVYAVSGRSPRAVRWVQLLLGALVCAVIAGTARRLGGTSGGIAAGLLAAFHPFFVFYGTQLLSETLAVFLASLAWAFLIPVGGKVRHPALAGIAWGLAALTRSVFVPLAAVPAVYLLWSVPRRWKPVLVFSVCAVCTVLPWSIRNTALHGRFVPVSTNGGYNFYLGSAGFMPWSGRTDEPLPPDAPFDDTVMEGSRPPVSETTAERNAYLAGMAFVAAHPATYLKYVIIKMYDFWHILLSGTNGAVMRIAVCCYGMVLLAGGFAGITALRAGPLRPFAVTAAFFLIASTLIHAVFISNIRMRVPLADPLLLLTAAAGIPYLFIRLFRRRHMQHGTTVLMYHSVVTGPDDLVRLVPADRPYAVTLDRFRRQLDMIRDNGNRIILTFDDGFDDFVRLVLPELEKRSMTATLFMTSGFIGTPGYLSAAGLKKCADSGITVGSHGHTHRFFSLLTDAELRDELVCSRTAIQAATGRPVDTLSLPGGRGEKRLAAIAAAGYTRIYTSRFGRALDSAAATGIRRIPVVYGTTEDEFEKIITGDPVHFGWLELSAASRNCLRRIMGDRAYDRVYALRYGGGNV